MEDDRPTTWSIDVWEDSKTGKSPFDRSFAKLGQYEQAVVLEVIDKIVKRLGIDVCDTEWGKPLGDGLYEIRMRRSLQATSAWGQPDADSAQSGADGRSVLIRLFVTFHGERVVLLFQAYDKGRDPSTKRQEREVKAARKYLKAWRSGR
ncbi:hypothetical protein [Georgenia yuyongxinii]